jgi:type IV pilus assembly protein PilO
MTNLQDGANRISTPVLQRLWLWMPIGAGALLAATLAAVVLTPLWLLLQRDSERLREVQALSARLADERQRAASLSLRQEQAQAQRAGLVRLISGDGDLSTFMATLDRLAKAQGVQLDLFEPTQTASGLDRNKDGRVDDQEKQAKPPADPLEIEGIKRDVLILSARGAYPQLLAFLRELEALNVLVVQTDLDLNLEVAPAGAPPAAPTSTNATAAMPAQSVLLKMVLSLYSKPPATKPAAAPN